MSVPDGPFEPDVAMTHIDRVVALVRSGRRWRAGSFAGVGLVTVGYFAVLGGIQSGHHDGGKHPGAELLNIVMTMLPTLAVIMMMEIFKKHRAVQSRRMLRREYILAGVYAGLTCVAGFLAVLLPHPFPAALSGVVPAVPCFIGAWIAARPDE
jgi:hypothetical protein